MQRIIKFLVVLTVLATATLFIESTVLAAEVTKIHTSKGHVTIDQGKSAGFTLGAEVCIYSNSGEEIACGRVRRTSETSAMVQVNNRLAKKIERGMTARLMSSKTHRKED